MGVSLGFDRSSEQSKTGGVKERLIETKWLGNRVRAAPHASQIQCMGEQIKLAQFAKKRGAEHLWGPLVEISINLCHEVQRKRLGEF